MKTSLLALGLLAALPFAASAADNISYNYVEGDYVKTNIDGPDADGWGIKGSYAFHPNFHVFGGYTKQKFDGAGDLDLNQWNVGVGYNYAISNSTDLLARVSYQNLDPEHYRKDFNGWATEVGINNSFGPRFSAYLLAGYEDYAKRDNFNPDGEFYGRLGGQFNVNKNWAVSGDVKMYTDNGDVQWSVGPRFSW
ncbi:Ax21 family protein [Stenotrophomonas sp. HITSZ_GD]|uniref:OmpO family porin n=1 Tax=Stenotrophomonas sp. HITSZ_GD TaxID=3037248 RepID=UPI00240DB67D|nr:Ax21 family protein [Stenotrophomonas sp. HITSZ_GD]MDG2523917.1 Ax21 family protein [Stenotrophomonas sp. HITSZ_GD]